jgi:hypothetical protein
MINGLIVGIVIACIGLMIASMRSGSSAKHTLKIIVRFAQTSGYKVVSLEEISGEGGS